MTKGYGYSLALHIAIVALLYFGIPISSKPILEDYAIITEVVPVSAITNVKVKSSDKKEDTESQTKKAPKSQEVKQEEAVKNSQPDNTKEQAEKIPDQKEKKTEKKPEKPSEKKPEKKEDQPKKKEDDSFEKSILKSLQEESKKKDDNKKIDKEFKELSDSIKGDTNKEFNNNLPMSVSEIDAIKAQIVKNWNTTSFSGADEQGMQVIVIIELDISGNILKVSPKRGSSASQYYSIFVESAVRAVRKSSPLQNLPKDKYHNWKEIEFRFDSSGMIY